MTLVRFLLGCGVVCALIPYAFGNNPDRDSRIISGIVALGYFAVALLLYIAGVES